MLVSVFTYYSIRTAKLDKALNTNDPVLVEELYNDGLESDDAELLHRLSRNYTLPESHLYGLYEYVLARQERHFYGSSEKWSFTILFTIASRSDTPHDLLYILASYESDSVRRSSRTILSLTRFSLIYFVSIGSPTSFLSLEPSFSHLKKIFKIFL